VLIGRAVIILQKVLKKKSERKARRAHVERVHDDDDDEGWVTLGEKERPKLFEKDAKITKDAVVHKFEEIITARGKKGTRNEMVELLLELMVVSDASGLGDGIHMKILLAIITSTFEHSLKLVDCMSLDGWKTFVH